MNNMKKQQEPNYEEVVYSAKSDCLIAPRKPIFAAVMSAMLPGFGQLYNGQINKSLWFFVAFCLIAIPLTVIIALYLPVWMTVLVLTAGVLIPILIWGYGILDAWRNARQLGNYRLKPWQTSGMYTVVFLVCSMLILPSMIFWIRDNQVKAFHTPSGSMIPTIQRGDMIFADMWYNCPWCRTSVSHGDVSIFVYPNNRNHYYIKRVLGLPGDKIKVSNDGVSINGELLGQRTTTSQGELTESFNGKSWQVIWDANEDVKDYEITVTSGSAFVLGDNRSNSNDSRVFGLVPLSDIVGLSRQVWFSKGPDGIRWSRLGKSLQPQ